MEQVYRIKNMKKFEGKSLKKLQKLQGMILRQSRSMLTRRILTILYVPSKGVRVNWPYFDLIDIQNAWYNKTIEGGKKNVKKTI